MAQQDSTYPPADLSRRMSRNQSTVESESDRPAFRANDVIRCPHHPHGLHRCRPCHHTIPIRRPLHRHDARFAFASAFALAPHCGDARWSLARNRQIRRNRFEVPHLSNAVRERCHEFSGVGGASRGPLGGGFCGAVHLSFRVKQEDVGKHHLDRVAYTSRAFAARQQRGRG